MCVFVCMRVCMHVYVGGGRESQCIILFTLFT